MKSVKFKHLSLSWIIFLLAAMTSMACRRKPSPPPEIKQYPGYFNKPLGASAHDLLNDKIFTSLMVEWQYMPGFQPENASVEQLKNFLQRHVHKPDGIEVVLLPVTSPGLQAMPIAEVRNFENKFRKHHTTGKQLTVYLLTTDGNHSDKSTLGMAYRNTSAVLFGGAIEQHAGPGKILSKQELEAAVLLHEMGHLLGLGISQNAAFSKRSGPPGQHYHCDNEMCLMYYKTETRNRQVIERKGKLPQLDAACQHLLESTGGKPPPFKGMAANTAPGGLFWPPTGKNFLFPAGPSGN